MSELTLGPIFSRPLHVSSWAKFGTDRRGSLDYRVTNSFDGPDYLNGGIHRATDVGNTRMGEPLRAPARCPARGLRHFDGALGVEFALSSSVTLALWHLSRVDVPGTWTPIPVGARIGLTGNSGAKLPDGSPMPAHTHIRGERAGVPFDVEPFLAMVERAAKPLPLESEDVKIPPGLQPLAIGVVGGGNRLRVAPDTADGATILDQDFQVQVYGRGVPGEPYTLGGRPGNTYAWVGQFGQLWYVADPLLGAIRLTGTAPAADCVAQDNKIAAARTAARGAAQAIAAAEAALA